jgi:putative alpha-1,2-mannosidase
MAMVKDAEVQPPNNNDPMAPDSSTKEGRGALPDWIKLGWISPKFTRSVSRAVDYAVNDFGLYQVAKGLGRVFDAQKYLARSRNWRNHWNPAAHSLGFFGFMVPRLASGKFKSQDPLLCGGCYWGDDYYEASPWEYTFGAYHDVLTMVTWSGGPQTFVKKLMKLFEPGMNPNGDPRFQETIFNPGNEPSKRSFYYYGYLLLIELPRLRIPVSVQFCRPTGSICRDISTHRQVLLRR